MPQEIDSVYYTAPEPDEPFFDDAEVEGKPKRFRRVARIVVGLSVVGGMIYISGVYQALFYSETPAGIEQREVGSLLDADTITIPLRVFVLVNDDGSFGSERSAENITQIVHNASEIWNQADIEFEVDRLVFLEASDADIGMFLDNPTQFLRTIQDYDPYAINVFFARTLKGLQGINGIAFMGIRAVAVADLTTVYDFRVLAHEIGHILGLPHTEDSNSRLMYRGANGFDITTDEALRAREAATKF